MLLNFGALIMLASCLAAETEATLEIGQPAPMLAVSSWIKGRPIDEFRQDHIYVIELWATWCGPCLGNVPHLNAVQAKYVDRVTVVGVGIWEDDPGRVGAFVQELPGGMEYSVAVDDVLAGDVRGVNGRCATTWMTGAGIDTIPTTFVVANGAIVWIGMPTELDRVLEDLIAGRWDVEAAAGERRATLHERQRYTELWPMVQATFCGDRATPKSIAAIDQAIEDDPSVEMGLARLKYQHLIELGDLDEAFGYGARAVDTVLRDQCVDLHSMAWLTLNLPADGRDATPGTDLALKAAARAVDLTRESEGSFLNTLSRMQLAAGETAAAVATLEKAIQVLGRCGGRGDERPSRPVEGRSRGR